MIIYDSIKIHVIEACSVIELVRHHLVLTLIQILECSSELPLMYSICKHSLVAPLFQNGSSYNHFTQWVPQTRLELARPFLIYREES